MYGLMARPIQNDLTGGRFGYLTALYPVHSERNGRLLWHCRCDCGKECDVEPSNLIFSTTRSCGCLRRRRTAEVHIREIPKGTRYGHWTVVERHEGSKVLCRCDCGTEREVDAYALRSGRSKSCGCSKGNTG